MQMKRRHLWIAAATVGILAVTALALWIAGPRAAGGVHFARDDELRARMVRVMARREAEPPAARDDQELRLLKLYDGALLCFAEAARDVWPDLDISALERCSAFEDEGERREYRDLAAHLIGSVLIDKPEDITYWVNRETLQDLWK